MGHSWSRVPYKCIYISLLMIHGLLLVILLHLNHYNDATVFVSLIPSVFGVTPSVFLSTVFFSLYN